MYSLCGQFCPLPEPRALWQVSHATLETKTNFQKSASYELIIETTIPDTGGHQWVELNNKTAHRTHNNTVPWFIPLQSNSQNSHQTRWKNLEGKLALTFSFFVSSSPSLLSSHVLITLLGSPSPNLVVLLNVTKLWGLGLVNLSYRVASQYWQQRHHFI